MNAYTFFMIVFLVSAGFFMLGWFAPYSAIVGAIAAFATATLIIFDRR